MSVQAVPLLVSIEECRRLIESGQHMDLVDVRTAAEFDQIHATGARLMPLDKLNPLAIARRQHDPDDRIYVICHSGARSEKACRQLIDAGLENVYSVEGGTVAWEKAGLAVERGTSRVISLERQVRVAAGALVLVGIALAQMIHPAFVLLSAFIGAGLVFAGSTGFCGMGMLLAKMPWNRGARSV